MSGNDLSLVSFRSGQNDTDPAVAIGEDQVVLARNVEFFASMLGERRGGTDPIDLTGAGFSGSGSITVNAAANASWGVIGVTLAPNGVISAGSSASGGFGTNVLSYTSAYSVNASSNYLVVCVLGDSAADKVTGVTYNAVAMTLLKKLNAGSALGWMYTFGLAAPATGSHNVIISASGSCSTLGFTASDYLSVAASEPDSSTTQLAGVAPSTVNYLIVGGGGGGGTGNSSGFCGAGGGGGGGVLSGADTLVGTTFTVTVGAGGTGGGANPTSGGNSSFNGHTATGGGAGGQGFSGPAGSKAGINGGSGGGGGGDTAVTEPGGTGTGGQGNAGGTGFADGTSPSGGGGGGAGSVGGAATLNQGGSGGNGVASSISGASVTYGGGGGGAGWTANPATGGTGGGGNANVSGPGVAGAANLGGGGGAGQNGGGGGAGVVIISYAGPQIATGGTITSSGGNTIHTFTASGTFTITGSAMSVTTTYTPVAANTWAIQFSVNTQNQQTSVAGGALRVFAVAGSRSVTLADSNSALVAQAAIVDLSEWFPLGDAYNSELWAIAATPNASQAATLARRSTLATGSYVWSAVTPVDPLITSAPDIYLVNSQPLDGLLFWAYSSGIDRLHVWEPSTNTLRRAGLQQPSTAPTLVEDAGAGTYATKRYFRTRWIQKAGTKIVRRSEPSVSSNITPSGTKIGVTLTQVAGPGEGETHWEVEESLDNTTFNRIATVAVAVTTYDDQLASGSISTAGPTSEAIGAYLLQPSWKYLAVDNDRLIGAGHWFDPTRFSTVGWSPVGGDPGVGNGERQPIVTTGGAAITTTVVLDNNVGGPVTGLASGLLQPQYASTASPTSIFYVFKWQRIYMLVGTGLVAGAYTVTTLSSRRGAVPDSVFAGIDESGAPAVYFLDPLFGPSRISQTRGIETLPGIRTTWGRVNIAASDVIACGCYYPFKRQAIWAVSVDGGNTPSFGITYAVGETGHVAQSAADYVRGWTVMDGRRAQARCMTTYTELVTENGSTRLSIRPIIGLTSPDYVQRCDVDSTDAGQAFTATIISKPYDAKGLLQKWGAMSGSLLADAQTLGTLNLFLIADFGKLPSAGPFTVATAASSAGESKIIADLDAMVASGARFIQIEFTDSSTVVLS